MRKKVCEFFEFVFSNLDGGRAIRCPIKKYNNNFFKTRQSIYRHLIINGINKHYKWWFHHGEHMYHSNEESDDENDEHLLW